MTHVAIMEWNEGGRVTRCLPFNAEAEATAHVAEHAETYPGAFVVPKPMTPFPYWKVDPQNRKVDHVIDAEQSKALTVQVQVLVQAEATRRIDAVTGDDRRQQQALARGAVLTARVALKAKALSPAEQAEADQLIAVGDWVKAVRDEAARFIANDLPALTAEQKLNFNAATDVQWPTL